MSILDIFWDKSIIDAESEEGPDAQDEDEEADEDLDNDDEKVEP